LFQGGQQAYRGHYLNGDLFQGGQQTYMEHYKAYLNTFRDGPYVEYYPDGKIKERGQYQNDKQFGPIEQYEERPSGVKTVVYKLDGKTVTPQEFQQYVKPIKEAILVTDQPKELQKVIESYLY
jgi:antitoxin component YwqK of YwqJK toxin-antitoxin module